MKHPERLAAGWMRPYHGNGLVLTVPLPHPERMAAGMADVSDCDLSFEHFQRWPFRKLALHAVGLVFGLSALCAVLGVLAS